MRKSLVVMVTDCQLQGKNLRPYKSINHRKHKHKNSDHAKEYYYMNIANSIIHNNLDK